ncbi:MAG: YhcN/YlaJ family sporulation lipoprotein [Bacillus sp. (in: Bacteria)]|nr:YhcN/YlaJ family sporulation lipoprotein [Bacillus sp. (in: firmicutes)]
MRNIIVFFLSSLMFINGCVRSNDNEVQNKEQLITVKDSHIENVDRKTGQEISRRLVELATSVPHVNDATAVVLGPYALVGIDVDSNIERSEVGSIKYSVAESLKSDPYGAEAVVIADPDLYARLQEIGVDIQQGKPIQGIMNELADIAGRLMPEIPRHIVVPEAEDANDNEKKGLNEKEKQSLENNQQNQSNSQ